MKTSRCFLIVFVVLPALATVLLSYTEKPGQRKGILFRDAWKTTWFLRASAIRVGKPIEQAASANLGKPIVLNVTEFDTSYIPREYRSGSITNDEACRKQSETLDISISLKHPSSKPDNDIPGLELRIRNLGKRAFIFRHGQVMIHIFRKEARGVVVHPRPEQGMLLQLIDIQCKGTKFASSQKDWSKQPRLRHDETHNLTVPLVKFSRFNMSSDERKKLTLTAPNLLLDPGEYQVLVSYFNDYQNIRRLSNAIEFVIKNGRNTQQGAEGDAENRAP